MWSKMPPVKIMVVLLLSSPVMAGPYFYSAPWQSPQTDGFQQAAHPQPSRQYKPATVGQGTHQRPTKVYHFVVTLNEITPTYDQQKMVYNRNRETYQQSFQRPRNEDLIARSEKSYVPTQYIAMQHAYPYYGMRSYAEPFTKPYTSYDAPITPIQAQNTPAQPRSIKSEYQNFLREIAPQNGVNFNLQDRAKKQSHTKDTNNFAVLDPEILKVLEDLLFKEESRKNEEELKKVETVGVPFSSYGVPINQRRVVGIALEPSIRSFPVEEITI